MQGQAKGCHHPAAHASARPAIWQYRHCRAARLLVPVAGVVKAPTILVFDSGLGGLTVFREIAKARPDARYVYAADDAFFPYGTRSEAALVERLCVLMGELLATHRPDIVVLACNTAST